MGRKLILTGTKLTDPTAPVLPSVDLIMPTAGALLFLDPTHPSNPWPTFDLNNTALSTVSLPNLAAAQAKALIPAGTDFGLGARYYKNASMTNDGVNSKIERTGKGALHVAFSQSRTENAFAREVRIRSGEDISAYCFANKGHSFYVSYWGRQTRGAKAFTAGAPQHSSGNGSNNFFGFYTRPTSAGEVAYPTTNPPRTAWSHDGAYSSATLVGAAPLFQDVGIANASAAASVFIDPLTMVAPADPSSGLNMNSMIFYGFYMEDLTVSGRTYAQVNALVRAKYERDVKTTGGRYFGDTYTAPLA